MGLNNILNTLNLNVYSREYVINLYKTMCNLERETIEKYNPENEYFESHTKSYQKLCSFRNGFYGKLINEIEKYDMDILIYGSSGVAAVMKNHVFVPNDIDICMKNITSDKVIQLDLAIRNTIGDTCKIIIIRKPVTITWLIFDENHHVIMEKIQLNILDITNWREIFVAFHSDVVAVGYDIKYKQFVVMPCRWNKFVEGYPTEPVYFTSVCNIDNDTTLSRSAKKYITRGFNAVPILSKTFENNNTARNNSNQFSQAVDDFSPSETKTNKKRNLIQIIASFCYCDNYAISHDIVRLLDDINSAPNITNINNIHNYEYYYLPKKIINADILIQYQNDENNISLKTHVNYYLKNKELMTQP